MSSKTETLYGDGTNAVLVAVESFPAYLNVCLCEDGDDLHQFGLKYCRKHQAETLKSLCESGFSSLLFVKDDRGEIVPLRIGE